MIKEVLKSENYLFLTISCRNSKTFSGGRPYPLDYINFNSAYFTSEFFNCLN